MVSPHCGRVTAAKWLIDVIDGTSSYLAVGIGMDSMEHRPIIPYVIQDCKKYIIEIRRLTTVNRRRPPRLRSAPPPTGKYVISTSYAPPNCRCRRGG